MTGVADRAPRGRFERRLPAAPDAIPVLRHAASAYAQDMSFTPDLTHAVALAVTEAATNAVLHAFVDRTPGTVTLVAEPADGQVVFRVRDDGRGLMPRVDSPGLGLGIPLLGRLCAQFDVRPGPDGTGTEVRMAFDAPHVGREPAARLRERVEQALGSLADAVTVATAGGRTIYANQVAAELLGAAPDEVVDGDSASLAGRFRITLADGGAVAFAALPHQRVLAGEDHPEPQLTRSVHVATGRARWLLTQATPLRIPDLTHERLAVSVIRDVTAATDAEQRRRVLDEAGERLAAAVGVGVMLGEVAALAVPLLADWCAFDVLDAEGRLERVALAHRDPEKVALGQEIQRRFPPDPSADQGVSAVMRTGAPLFLPDVPDEMLAAGVADPEHLALLRAVGMRSVLAVPLAARGQRLGVLTLVTADSARAFGAEDLEFALVLGRRAGLAVHTAGRLQAS